MAKSPLVSRKALAPLRSSLRYTGDIALKQDTCLTLNILNMEDIFY